MASIISIIVSTVIFLIINPISSSLVDDICNHFPKFEENSLCYSVFYNDGAATDVQVLAQSIIDQTYRFGAVPASHNIENLLSKTNDAQLKQVYNLCKNYFSDALSSLSAANAKLKSHDYPGIKMDVNAFSRDVASCRKTFSLAPSKRIEILHDVAVVELYNSILALTIAKL